MNIIDRKKAVAVGDVLYGLRRNRDRSDNWTTYRVDPALATTNKGKGGAATVHHLQPRDSKPKLVGKLYNDKVRGIIRRNPLYAQRVLAMVMRRDELHKKMPWASWPRRALFLDKPRREADIPELLVGFTMAELENTNSLADLLTKRNLQPLLTRESSWHLAVSLSVLLMATHVHDDWNFVIGDLSPHNIHVNDKFSPRLIDTDSWQYDFQHQGKVYAFHSGDITPAFVSPDVEAMKKAGRFTKAHDEFVLAINLYYLLLAGRNVPKHPFEVRGHNIGDLITQRKFPAEDPKTYPVVSTVLDAYRRLPREVRDAFIQTFTTPTPVSAKDWSVLLIEPRIKNLLINA